MKTKLQIILIGPAYNNDHITPSHGGITWSLLIGRGNGAQGLNSFLTKSYATTRRSMAYLLKSVVVPPKINSVPVTISASIV